MAVDISTYMSFRGSGVFSSTDDNMDGPAYLPAHKLYWLVETNDNGEMSIRRLDDSTWLPGGAAKPITLRELQRDKYTPEPDLYMETVYPRLQAQVQLPVPQDVPPAKTGQGRVALDDVPAYLDSDPIITALREKFVQAVGMAENGNLDQAGFALTKILKDSALTEKKHRHLFNEFGINLRKNRLVSQSIDFYTRALELTGEEVDENLHFNLARALFDEERYMACTQHLFKALNISPDNWAVLRFLAWMQDKGLIPKQYHLDVKSRLARGIPDIPKDVLKAGAAVCNTLVAADPRDSCLLKSLPDMEDLMG